MCQGNTNKQEDMMTKHTNHNHPNTPAARAACRKATAKKLDAIMGEMKIDAFPPAIRPEDPPMIHTPRGNVREGSTIEVMFRGDVHSTLCTVDRVDENIKNDRPGFELTEVITKQRRWAYADQTTAIFKF